MKKVYDVVVRYEGSVGYTVEAENEDEAKEVVQKLFDEESCTTIEANIDNIECDVSETNDIVAVLN